MTTLDSQTDGNSANTLKKFISVLNKHIHDVWITLFKSVNNDADTGKVINFIKY